MLRAACWGARVVSGTQVQQKAMVYRRARAAALIVLVTVATATPNAGPRPPMGWNSWESYEGAISAQLFTDTASAMVRLGLPALGYDRFNTDSGWEDYTFPNGSKRPCAGRGADGLLSTDPAKFPEGLRPVATHVQSLGLNWGMYLPFHACPATGPTRFDNAAADIKLCAQLNATFVKVDALRFSTSPTDTQKQMRGFQRAIRESSMPHMFFSNCHMGCMSSSDERRGGWAPWCSEVSDMWRTSRDLEPNWKSFLWNLGTMVGRGKDAGPHIGWNNPDILEVGVLRKGMTPLTVVEAQTHFSLWCVTSSPLLLSMELVGGNTGTPIWNQMMDIVKNPHAIWVTQA